MPHSATNRSVDASVLLLLPRIDDDLAAKARAAGCQRGGGRLDISDYPRQPRGASATTTTGAGASAARWTAAANGAQLFARDVARAHPGRWVVDSIEDRARAAHPEQPDPWSRGRGSRTHPHRAVDRAPVTLARAAGEQHPGTGRGQLPRCAPDPRVVGGSMRGDQNRRAGRAKVPSRAEVAAARPVARDQRAEGMGREGVRGVGRR